MPSVISSSVAKEVDSSTVMTPSALTLPMASAIIRPISSSLPELTSATWRIASPATGWALSAMPATIWAVAFSMPRRNTTGLAPAATFLRPSRTSAWASRVAVVVPSPAVSLVLLATCCISLAPTFSKGSSSSISRAMVTPSLTISGAPNFFSSTTLRPRGPMVTFTALARAFTPRSRAPREASEKLISLAMKTLNTQLCQGPTADHRQANRAGWGKPNQAAALGY